MKLLLSILLVILPAAGDAKCLKRVKNLVSVEVFRCQATIIKSDNRDESIHRSNTEVLGTFISGYIVESKHVVAIPDTPGGLRRVYKKPLELTVGNWELLFLPRNTEELCSKLEPRVAQWFVTKDRCLDSLPIDGFGLVPYKIPFVELEPDPEKWHAYGAFDKDES